MSTILLTLLSQLLLITSTYSSEYLVFTSPGGTEHHGMGIFGGSISVDHQGNSGDLYQYGYKCNPEDDSLEGLKTTSMSYDPVSGGVLFHIDSGNANVLTLHRGEVCSAIQECDGNTNSTMEVLASTVGIAHHIGAVAYYNSEIYFTMFNQESLGSNRHQGTIQIRKLTLSNCDSEFPLTATTLFDLEACSEEIASVATAEFGRSKTIKMTGHLQILPLEHTKLYFYTQIERITYGDNNHVSEYVMELWEVCPMKEVELIHEQPANTRLALFDFIQIGGIDYRSGKLCWAAMENVLCAGWNTGDIADIEVVLEADQIGQVCTGPHNIATGIAIADVDEYGQSFYFGCMADSASTGGGGLVRISSQKEDHTDIYPLHHQASPVYAGSMFLTKSCEGTGIVGGSATTRASIIFIFTSMLVCLLEVFAT